jgi:hypothetical protein
VTAYDRGSVTENGRSAQYYFGLEFWVDSRCPLECGDTMVWWPTPDGGIHGIPLRELDVSTYPVTLSGPPTEAVPPSHRALLTADSPESESSTD